MKKGNIGILVLLLLIVCVFAYSYLLPGRRVSGGGSGGEESLEIPDAYQEVLNGNHEIDAQVNVPDCIREKGFREAWAVPASNDHQTVLSLFEEYAPRQVEVDDSMTEKLCRYEGEDGFFLLLFYGDSHASMSSRQGDCIKMAYRYDERTDGYNRELYSLTQQLASFPRRECEERIRAMCRALGVKGDYKVAARLMEHETMEREAVQLNKDGTEQKPDYTFGEADDGYFCTISQLCNDIPVLYSYSAGLVESDVLNYGPIECYLTKERIPFLYVDYAFDITYGESYLKLLPFTRVVERYWETRELEAATKHSRITRIELRALAVQDGTHSCRIEPVWFFAGYEWNDGEISLPEMPFSVGIHAVTGEEV